MLEEIPNNHKVETKKINDYSNYVLDCIGICKEAMSYKNFIQSNRR